MDLDKLNYLPKWDEHASRTEEGEEWKLGAELGHARDLYKKWREIFGLLLAFVETLQDDDASNAQISRSLIMENAMTIAPKILSAARDTSYIIKIENAAIIRYNCMQLMTQVSYAAITGAADSDHKEVIEQSMDDFRKTFKDWVALFKKDEYEDEWGMFSREDE